MINLYRIKIAYYDLKCLALRLSRTLKNHVTAKHSQPTHLFILSPPYAGSTLVQEWLSTSAMVSANNIFGTREGQGLPEVRHLIDHRRQWDHTYTFPWPKIEAAWNRYWDHSKALLLDKSPANIFRAKAIEKHFKGCAHVVIVRNPYAHCDSLMRRDKMTAPQAATFCLRCLEVQKENLQQSKNSLLLRYEDLTDDPQAASKNLQSFLPQLGNLDTHKKFKAHNYKHQSLPITNLNKEKINRLTNDQLDEINPILAPKQDILAFFGYSIL